MKGLVARIVVFGIVVGIVQVTFVSQFPVAGGTADLAPLAVMSIGLLCGGLVGASFGFGLGLFLDVSLLQTLGRDVAHPRRHRLLRRAAARRPRGHGVLARPAAGGRRGDRHHVGLLLDHPVPARTSARRSAACCCASCWRPSSSTPCSPCPSTPSRGAGSRARCPSSHAAGAASPPRPRRSRRCSRACARRGRGGPPSHDRSRRRSPPADQPPARLAGRPPGRDRARALRDRLLPALVPAGAVRRPVPRRGERQPGPPGAHPGARAGTSSTATARRSSPTAGRSSSRSARRPARRRARGGGDLGPADDPARACARRASRASRRRSPTSRRQELRDRLRRLAGVLENTTATEIQRRIIQSLAQRAVRADPGGDRRPALGHELRAGAPDALPERDRRAGLPAPVPAHDARRPDARHRRGDPARSSSSGSTSAASSRAPSSARAASSTSTTATCAARDGSREIQVDALGNPKGELREVAPKAGQRLKLSLDLALQSEGQEALTRPGQRRAGAAGAFVAMNPDNGEILGMGSLRRFDPNLLDEADHAGALRRALRRAGGRPAVQPRHERPVLRPGSTFKAVTALAGAAERDDHAGHARRGQRLHRDRRPQVLQRQERAQRLGRHAQRDQVSSDVYFYLLGQNLDAKKGRGAPEVRPRARLRPRHGHRPPVGGRRRRPRPRVAQARRGRGAS